MDRWLHLSCFCYGLIPVVALIHVTLKNDVVDWFGIVRIVAITLGLLYLGSRRGFGKQNGHSETERKWQGIKAYICPLMCIFIVVELSSSSSAPSDALNSTSIYETVAYILIFSGFGFACGWVWAEDESGKVLGQIFAKTTSKLIVICSIALVIILWLFQKPENSSVFPLIGSISIFCGFSVLFWASRTPAVPQFMDRILWTFPLVVFCLVSIIGIGRISYVSYLGNVAQRASAQGEIESAERLYSRFFDFVYPLGLGYTVQKDLLDSYFLAGSYRIRKKEFARARSILNKGADSTGEWFQLLGKLRGAFGGETAIVQETWGDDIFLTLEDFRSSDPGFRHYTANDLTEIVTDEHSMVNEEKEGGKSSEHIKVRNLHGSSEYNYWIFPIGVELKEGMPLGIRVFVRFGAGSSLADFRVEVQYANGWTGIWDNFEWEELGGGRYVFQGHDLFSMARIRGESQGFDTREMSINGLILNMTGPLVDIYIEEIQLFTH
jgi:hypothetical protein